MRVSIVRSLSSVLCLFALALAQGCPPPADDEDAATPADAGRSDLAQPDSASVDGAPRPDATTAPDAVVATDTAVPPDSAVLPDATVRPDTATPPDTAASPDTAVPVDAAAADAVREDVAVVADAAVAEDAGAEDGGAQASLSIEQFCLGLVNALCAQRGRCCDSNDLTVLGYLNDPGCGDPTALPHYTACVNWCTEHDNYSTNRHFDGVAASSCVAAYDTLLLSAGCGLGLSPAGQALTMSYQMHWLMPGCHHLFYGDLAPTSACPSQFTCADGYNCDVSYTDVCIPRVGAGQGCHDGLVCELGLVCGPENSQCRLPGGSGAQCGTVTGSMTAPCAPDFRCDIAASPPVCVGYLENSDTCAPAQPTDCRSGFCDPGWVTANTCFALCDGI